MAAHVVNLKDRPDVESRIVRPDHAHNADRTEFVVEDAKILILFAQSPGMNYR
ncbi:hypothetical protein K2X89_04625 [Myxococcota bacterium]|nr:hypothetical protein [Myxococcota bacterium]